MVETNETHREPGQEQINPGCGAIPKTARSGCTESLICEKRVKLGNTSRASTGVSSEYAGFLNAPDNNWNRY